MNKVGVSYNSDLKAIKQDNERRQLDRFRRQRISQVQAEKEHREAFSRPLISDSLLTSEERSATRTRVNNSGQRQWRMKGESV